MKNLVILTALFFTVTVFGKSLMVDTSSTGTHVKTEGLDVKANEQGASVKIDGLKVKTTNGTKVKKDEPKHHVEEVTEDESEDNGVDLIINDDNQTKTLECNHGEPVVNGNNNNVTFKGACKEIIVNGENNKVSLEKIKSIVVNGDKNSVTWVESCKGGKPAILNNGNKNSVKQIKKK
ncbi:DUF3060 domain-containing protein [bacterium]|nr:DUF3060 domain-containing protein [bacterium]